ncbi:MAG TPA: adenosylmethionine decarboxylase [Pseudonocardia sp.]|nr:adenosylmethionine decarboxylase [Pseudonocardia sp.]
MRPFTGRHVLAELTGVDPALLDDEATIREVLVGALTEAGASVLQTAGHRFDPRGLTVLAMLSESHASVHTWPEHGSAFVDVFTCGEAADPERAVQLLATRLGATSVHRRTVDRGESPARSGAPPPLRVNEPLSAGLRRVWDVEPVIWSGRTAFQDVLIGGTAHGVTLFCDDERQSSEASQLVYHEALLVPALLLAERVDQVLVIGSSEGVVSGLAVAAGARRVDHVDIDAECVKLCARYLPYGYTPDDLAAAELGNGPVTVHYIDGWQYLHDTGRRYDLVVIDLPDERPEDTDAQHNRLYGVEFLRLASAVLAPGGVLVGQVGCPTLWRNDTLRTSLARYREVFATVSHYGSDEHEWSFLTGAPEAIADPVRRMTERLATLPYRPVSIDAEAIRRGAVLPASLRGHGDTGCGS